MSPFLDIICLATSFTLQKITKRNRPFKSHHGILITDINRIRPIRCFSSRFKVTHVVDHCKQLPFKLVTPTPFFSHSQKKTKESLVRLAFRKSAHSAVSTQKISSLHIHAREHATKKSHLSAMTSRA